MDEFIKWNEIVYHSFLTLGQKIMNELPNVIGAIVLIIVGWFLAKLVSYLVKRLLTAIKLDSLMEKLDLTEALHKANIEVKPSHVVSKFAYWVILLIFFTTASDAMGWVGVSGSINDLLTYLPRLFSAIVVFVLGLYIAAIVKDVLNGIFASVSFPTGGAISTFAYYIIVIIISLTSLNQAGVDTSVITTNLNIILGGIVLAFAVSFGLGAKDTLSNIISSYYLKSDLKKGQKVLFGTMNGVIEKIERTSVSIRTSDGLVIVPTKKLASENITIKE